MIRKTPVVTIVAPWITADTGVGPSIISGSKVCKPNYADFPMAAINSKIVDPSSTWSTFIVGEQEIRVKYSQGP